jgi:hypothetical protein
VVHEPARIDLPSPQRHLDGIDDQLGARVLGIDQPTTIRLWVSASTARYGLPAQVRIWVMWATHRAVGRSRREDAIDRVGSGRPQRIGLGGAPETSAVRAFEPGLTHRALDPFSGVAMAIGSRSASTRGAP